MAATKPIASAGARLCRLEAIEDGNCAEIPCGTAADAPRLIVMRSADSAWAYLNRCPHFSLPLNAGSSRFLIVGRRQVMCAYHCAVFRFEDGMCVDGPAKGMSLESVPVSVVDGTVIIA
jgi:nitrite reductase/ring-hydroxylating ferredoxin subunit